MGKRRQTNQKSCWRCGTKGYRFVQVWNPRGFWVLLDRKIGQVIDSNKKALPKIFKYSKKYKGKIKVKK